MKTLHEIYQKYKYPDGDGDKGTAHTYIQEYETILTPYRTNPNCSFLEIGVSWGLSIRMWREYFIGSVMGVDIKLHQKTQDMWDREDIRLIQCDATKAEFLNYINDTTFDVIIDDGSHTLEHQVASFNLLKSRMRPNGLYIIEDIENIDSSLDIFQSLWPKTRIVDNRIIKNRQDDVLVIYQF